MRLAVLAAVLLAAGPALAQTAPPSAADSALVERYLTMSREAAQGSAAMLADAPGPASTVLDLAYSEATQDSVRAALYADLRPALLAEAVAFAEGPVFARVTEQSSAITDSLSFAELQALIADPGDRPLADSALAARYAAATLAVSQPAEAQDRMLDLMIEALPEEMLDTMGGADAFREIYTSAIGSADIQGLQDEMTTNVARLTLAGIDEADVRSFIDYLESDAALYAGRISVVGSMNAIAPKMAEVMGAAFAAPPPPGGAPSDTTVTVRRAPAPTQLFEALERVQAQLVYPDAARAEGVEGAVTLQLRIGPDGEVLDATVTGSPDPRLAAEVLRAVRAADLPGGGVPIGLPYTFRFSLDGAPVPLGGGPGADGLYLVTDTPAELIGGLDSLAARVVYPEAARRAGVEGRVIVQFIVDEGGAVEDPEVLRSPDPRLSTAALAAVRASRFLPATAEGEPVKVRFALPVTFRLDPPNPVDALLPPIAPDADGVYERSEVLPQLVGGLAALQRELRYPQEARDKGIEGQVVVQFVVSETGAVRSPRVLRPIHPLLDEAALDAVRRSRFEPGTVGGEPVAVRMALPLSFRLR